MSQDIQLQHPSSPAFVFDSPEADQPATLVGYICHLRAEEHAVELDNEGRVVRAYGGNRWNGVANAEWPGRIMKGLSGVAVRIFKTPGSYPSIILFS